MKKGDTVNIQATVVRVIDETHYDVEIVDEQGRVVALTVRKSNG